MNDFFEYVAGVQMSLLYRSAWLLWLSSICLSFALFSMVKGMGRVVPLPVPRGGLRAAKRRRARASMIFRSCESALLWSGGAIGLALREVKRVHPRLRGGVQRFEESQRKLLIWSGQPAGLHSLELMCFSVVGAVLGALLGVLLSDWFGTWLFVLPGTLLSACLPQIRLQALASQRFFELRRELPTSIDLTTLAMNAGLDFPTAMARVSQGQKGVVAEEFGQLLHALDLGITRTAALIALQERAPISEVKDLVRAVVLAEKKGAPLTEALAAQARVSRERRGVRAEEAAARAGVLLLLPLMLLMCCIMIMLMGPLLCEGLF